MTGLEPENLIHIDKNKLNNKWDNLKNLRIVREHEGVNLHILPKPTGRKHLGSRRLENRNRWRAIARIGNRLTILGTYKCPTAAHIAYLKHEQAQ